MCASLSTSTIFLSEPIRKVSQSHCAISSITRSSSPDIPLNRLSKFLHGLRMATAFSLCATTELDSTCVFTTKFLKYSNVFIAPKTTPAQVSGLPWYRKPWNGWVGACGRRANWAPAPFFICNCPCPVRLKQPLRQLPAPSRRHFTHEYYIADLAH